MTSGSFWKYYRDEVKYCSNENNDGNNFRIKISKQRQVNLLSIRQEAHQIRFID